MRNIVQKYKDNNTFNHGYKLKRNISKNIVCLSVSSRLKFYDFHYEHTLGFVITNGESWGEINRLNFMDITNNYFGIYLDEFYNKIRYFL